ncbi:MAG: Gfo/Idh/MocA family protein, partial [Bryobacteraceae bacterium]
MKNQESNQPTEQNNDTSRRDLLRTALAAAAVIGGGQSARAQSNSEPKQVGKTVIGMPFEPRDQVRMGLVGAGGRGTGMLKEYLAAGNLQVTAVCDIVKDHALNAQSIVERAGQKPPAIYTGSDTAFESLAARDDIDFVYIATPWEWHVPAGVAAMTHGKHAFIEVPAATTLEDCWKLVNTSEQTRRHCLICENCCYGYNELMILNMVRDGAFGDLYHGEGAYLHDLRRLLFADEGEGLWRRFPHTKLNGNLYPTHGLGPVANYMSVNRGDRFDYMVSMSSRERGLDAWREAHIPKDSPKWKEKYICGDMSTSLIRTANGLTIVLKNDTVNPRPYDRLNTIEGTKGIFHDYPPRIYFDGTDPEEFSGIDKFKAQYEHQFWKSQAEQAQKMGGHGG